MRITRRRAASDAAGVGCRIGSLVFFEVLEVPALTDQ